jgi:hypothetical protein
MLPALSSCVPGPAVRLATMRSGNHWPSTSPGTGWSPARRAGQAQFPFLPRRCQWHVSRYPRVWTKALAPRFRAGLGGVLPAVKHHVREPAGEPRSAPGTGNGQYSNSQTSRSSLQVTTSNHEEDITRRNELCARIHLTTLITLTLRNP